MNDPGPDKSDSAASPSQSGASATVPAEAFSPAGLAAHLARTGRTGGAINLSAPDVAGAPSLEHPSLAERLRRFGRRVVDPPQLRFEVERVLGVGATGRVFAVRDRNLQRAVAVKFLGDGQRPSEQADIDHFIDEAQITASLEHPNVLPVHELDINDAGQVFFSMKQIDGQSLGALIEQSTWGQRAAPIADRGAVVNLIIGVCQALAYAHDRGIVHQDVKPDNVMVGDYGEVLLVDWGSAVRIRAEGKPRLYGTPLYMSPEQARTESVDERSDVYCLGATLFHALTLRCPTWSDDAERFWRMKRTGEIQPPTAVERAAIPEPLLDIALKAMAADPVHRYASATQMLADLRSYQSGLAVIAHRDTWSEIVARWHRRHWRALWATTAMATVALALAALLYGERLKEVATWGPPLLSESFADGTWASRWRLIDGEFAERDRRLVATGKGEGILLYPRKLWGPLAIEVDAEILPGSQPGDISLLWARDLDQTRTSPLVDGFRFQVGAFDGAYSAIRNDSGQHLASDYFRPEVGRTYRIRAEIEDYRLTLSVDGRVICRWTDTVRFDCGYIGLYTFYDGKAFSNLRIYSRGIAQKIPATAIGDSDVRLKQYDAAYEQYQRVVDAYPDASIGREALHKQGLCRWEQGRHREALERWAPLADSEYGPLVRLYAIDERFSAGDHDGILAELEALYRDADADLRKRVAMQWGHYLDSLRAANDRAGMARYLAVHDRVFPHETVVDSNAAAALLHLGRYEELLRVYPGQRRFCASALTLLDRVHEVVEHYSDQHGSYLSASFNTGEYERCLRDDFLSDLVRVRMGHAEDVLTHPHADANARFYALCATGQLDEAIRSEDPVLKTQALCFAGRAQETLALGSPHSAWGHLAMGDAAAALTDSPPGDHTRTIAEQLLGLQACIRGDADEARRCFAEATQPRYLNEAFAQDCLVPFLIAPGDEGAFRRAGDVAAAQRWRDGQRIWYMISYLRGEIDEAAFLKQPYRVGADARLLLYRGFRHERAGRPREALDDYRAYDALPLWRRSDIFDPVGDRFVRWRIELLASR